MAGLIHLPSIHTIPPYSNHLNAECEDQEEMRDDHGLQGNTQTAPVIIMRIFSTKHVKLCMRLGHSFHNSVKQRVSKCTFLKTVSV